MDFGESAYNQAKLNNLDTLTQINLEDLVTDFGWEPRSLESDLVRRLFLAPARLFARQMVSFDHDIAVCGLPEASRILQRNYVRDVRVHNLHHIPPGPVLAISNHPGMTDTISIFAALRRMDLKIVALPRPFLLAMPNLSRQLFYVSESASARMDLVRQAAAHLRGCGAVLTFPAGHIEPDPAHGSDALTSLDGWNASAGLFVRLAPETAIVPMLVRGVVWSSAIHSPLLLLKRNRRDKEKLAAALQLIAMLQFGMRPVTVHIQIGRPILPSSQGARSAKIIHEAVLHEMRSLISKAPEESGESVL